MCPPPFDPVADLNLFAGHERWFGYATVFELLVVGVTRLPQVTKRRHLSGTSSAVAAAAITAPILALILTLHNIPDWGLLRVVYWLGNEAEVTVSVAIFGTIAVLTTLFVLSAQWKSWCETEARGAIATTKHQNPFLLLALGIIPLAAATVQYVHVAYPLPSTNEITHVQHCYAWRSHWDLVRRVRPLLYVGVAWAMGVGVYASIQFLRQVERRAKELAEADARPMARVPISRYLCLGVCLLTIPATVWVFTQSVPVARELWLGMDEGCYDWSPGHTPSSLLAPHGEGPDELGESPRVEQRGGKTSLDGTVRTYDLLARALEDKRQLWNQVNPGRRFPGHLAIAAGEAAPLSELLPVLGAAQAANYSEVVLPLQNCVEQNRPLLGPLTACKYSAVEIELHATLGEDCVSVDTRGKWGDFVRALARKKSNVGRLLFCSLRQ